jgi:hypothetical protein
MDTKSIKVGSATPGDFLCSIVHTVMLSTDMHTSVHTVCIQCDISVHIVCTALCIQHAHGVNSLQNNESTSI